MNKTTLHRARINKKDEFYTCYKDIEKEMQYYITHLKDKIVYCNCDNPRYSAFWKYFHINFSKLSLKELRASYLSFSEKNYAYIYRGGNDANIEECERIEINGDGDFQCEACRELLRTSDIIITNPPFSVFREYVALLIQYKKDFIIIGNQNALTYKEIFPLVKNNKIWYGASIHSGDRTFIVPDSYPLEAVGCGITVHGEKFIRVKGVRWFTNVEYKDRYKRLILTCKYDPSKYPFYDNIDAINVDKVSDIPMDYNGIMGVPITFFDKYNPKQFEILGCTANPESNDVKKRKRSDKACRLIKEGRLKGAKCVGGNSNIYIDEDNYVHVIYHRLLIRRK